MYASTKRCCWAGSRNISHCSAQAEAGRADDHPVHSGPNGRRGKNDGGAASWTRYIHPGLERAGPWSPANVAEIIGKDTSIRVRGTSTRPRVTCSRFEVTFSREVGPFLLGQRVSSASTSSFFGS